MAQIVKEQKLTLTKEVLFTSSSKQIVFLKVINTSFNTLFVDIEWTGGKLLDNLQMPSSGSPIDYAFSQFELQMESGDTISGLGMDGMEYVVIC